MISTVLSSYFANFLIGIVVPDTLHLFFWFILSIWSEKVHGMRFVLIIDDSLD